MKYKFYTLNPKTIDKENRTLQAVISTETIDRHGEIVIQKGIDFSEFEKNPVVLNNHNMGMFGETSLDPIARVIDITRGDKETLATIQFPTADISPEGDKQWRLAEGGWKNAWSGGFNVIKEETQSIDGRSINVLEQTELVELSFVNVGANRETLTKALKSGLISKDYYNSYTTHFKKSIDNDVDNNTIDNMSDKQFEDLMGAVKSVATDMTAIKEWQESHGKKFDEFVAKSDEPEPETDDDDELTDEEKQDAYDEGYDEEQAKEDAKQTDEEEPKENEDDEPE